MTRGELMRRENAVVSAFVERDGEKTNKYIQELIEINSHGGYLFRYRPPEIREIEVLEEKKIFLCRPSLYEDKGDCEIRFDINDLIRYFMVEMKPEKYAKYANDANYESIINSVKTNPKFIALKERIKDQALTACFSEQYNDVMWKNYAKNATGICLMYRLQEVLINSDEKLMFFPVRYVDDRKHQSDIQFTSKEYNNTDDYEPAYYKFILSCLTKDKEPYYKEAEWRLFYNRASLPENEKGMKFDFLAKPIKIIMGKNIDDNIVFKNRVIEYAMNNNVNLKSDKEISS